MGSFETQNNFSKVTHCIFDMDGLLLDSENLYTKAIQKILDAYNKTYTWEVKMSMMGFRKEELAKKIVEVYDLPITWEEYAKLHKKHTSEIMANAQLMPDTESLYTKATQKILDSYGKIYTWEVKQSVMGFHSHEVAKKIVEIYDLPITWQEYVKLQEKYSIDNMINAQLMPGAKKILQHLHATEIPFCLATSSGKDMFEIKTTHHKELFSLFSHKVCGGTDPEVKQGKPAPDIFLVAASRFPDKPKPENCLVFEDAPNGVKAARSAGMQCIMVPDPRVPEELRSEATLVLNSLEEFKPELFGLPSFTS